MAAGLMSRGWLDPKRCWKDWHVRLGSLNKVQDDYLRKGEFNQKTGRPPTLSGIQKAAYSWALRNQEEARKDLEYAWMKEGVILTEEDWKKAMVRAARLIFHQRPKRFDRFIVQNGLHQYRDTPALNLWSEKSATR